MDIDFSKKTNERKLNNILSFASDICSRLSMDPKCERCINIMFRLIKINTDRILSEKILSVMDGTEISNFSFLNLMFEKVSSVDNNILNCIQQIELQRDICLHIPEIPLIVSPYSSIKLRDNIISESTDRKNWKQQTGINAQNFVLYLPIGITFVFDNGNHSTTGGYIKNAGNIIISNNNPHTLVYDMGKLYDIIRFDGTNYRLKSSNRKIAKEKSFEFGTTFEIGRIIKNYNISFTYNK